MANILHQIPNWLTFLRLILIPVFVLLLEMSDGVKLGATIVFVIAAITDYVDGYLARRLGATSDFGKLLDPLADKILVMTALVMLVAQRTDDFGEPWVPGWAVVLVLAREMWVTGLRGIAAAQGRVVGASGSGKVKSGLQMFAIFFLLLHGVPLIYLGGRLLTAEVIGFNLLLLSIVISYWSAYEYTTDILFNDEETAGEARDEAEGISERNIH